MSDDRYLSDGQQRVLRLLTVLAGHEITGLTPAEIAKAQDCSAPMVTRDLANLRAAGFAEQVPETGRWRLSPQIVQISIRHAAALGQARQRLDDITQRFSRS